MLLTFECVLSSRRVPFSFTTNTKQFSRINKLLRTLTYFTRKLFGRSILNRRNCQMSDKTNAIGDKSSVASPPVLAEEDEPERIPSQDSIYELAISDAEAALRAIRSSSHHIIDLFVPVTLCMVIVVVTINTVPSISMPRSELSSFVFGAEASKKTDTGSVLWHALSFALIILGFVIVMTIVVIVLYIWRFYKVLRGFLFLSSVILLFFFCFVYLQDVLTNYNKAMDYITLAMVLWNYGVVGLIAIHFSGPILLQQAYLILNSALLALTFIKLLPDWTIWFLLAIISIWDLIAVLTPMGPLRILVETAQERQEPLFPSLVYSTRMIWFYGATEEEDETHATGYKKPISVETDEKTKQLVAASFPPTDISSSNHRKTERWTSSVIEGETSESRANGGNKSGDMAIQLSPYMATEEEKKNIQDTSMDDSGQAAVAEVVSSNRRTQNSPRRIVEQLTHRESSGVKLGLGDFIFYSILVGKASATSDLNTTIACFIAILVGLSTTLLLLFIFRKALPALPISIAFGLTFYFVTSLVVVDFVDQCQLYQIYI